MYWIWICLLVTQYGLHKYKDLQNTLLKSHQQHLIKFYNNISEFWIIHILQLSL